MPNKSSASRVYKGVLPELEVSHMGYRFRQSVWDKMTEREQLERNEQNQRRAESAIPKILTNAPIGQCGPKCQRRH